MTTKLPNCQIPRNQISGAQISGAKFSGAQLSWAQVKLSLTQSKHLPSFLGLYFPYFKNSYILNQSINIIL